MVSILPHCFVIVSRCMFMYVCILAFLSELFESKLEIQCPFISQYLGLYFFRIKDLSLPWYNIKINQENKHRNYTITDSLFKFYQISQESLYRYPLILGAESGPGLYISFSGHGFWVSFNLEQILSLSVSFLTLTFLKAHRPVIL